MLSGALNELKAKEFDNVEKLGWDIASRIRTDMPVSVHSIVCVAYLGYLAIKNGINSSDGMKDYVENALPDQQKLFVKSIIRDSWDVILDVKEGFTGNNLLAVVLWYSGNGKGDAEMGTPASVCKLAASILEPSNRDKVIDMCCGTASFMEEIISNYEADACLGIEINTYSKEISAIRLSLLSENAEVIQGSVFSLDEEETYDKIFCNYPWSLRVKDSWAEKEDLVRLEEMIPELKKSPLADWHFIVNGILHLKDDGKMVAISTNGNTWNSGISRVIREKLVKLGYIEAVISLPANLFSGTAIATTLIVISKGNKKIRMIDASSMADVGRRQNVISDENIAKIKAAMNEDTDYSIQVSLKEIESKDFVINPARFLEQEVNVENGVPFESVIKNVTRGAQLKASELDDMVSDGITDTQYLMLANIQDGMIEENLPYLKAIDRKLEKYCIRDNSIVISKNGLPVKIAVASVEKGKKILGNGNLYIVEIDETKANPLFIKAFLESETGVVALSRIMVGGVMPNIPIDGLKKMLIPLPDLSTQNKIAEKYQIKQDELKILKYKTEKVLTELKKIFEEG